MLRQLLSLAYEYCCGEVFCCCRTVEHCRYFRNEKELGTGTVCTSSPLIDPASIFATGMFYLAYVQETRHIVVRFADRFSFRFFFMFVGALLFFVWWLEPTTLCPKGRNDELTLNIMHQSDS